MVISEGKATIRNSSLRTLIGLAYAMDASQVRGGSWLDEPRYDIEATSSIPPSHNHLVDAAIYRSLLASLLAERFNLSFNVHGPCGKRCESQNADGLVELSFTGK